MLRRLRLRVRVYLSAGMLLLGLSLGAAANEPITKSQAQAMIDGRLAAAGVLVFGAFWVLLLTFTGRQEKALTASILRLEVAVANFAKSLSEHDINPRAHTAASDHNHDPMNEKLDALAAGQHSLNVKLERLYSEHRVIRRTERCLLQTRTERRDPSDSPSPRRKDDPEDFDATSPNLRGLEPTNDAEEEPENET